MTRLAVVLLVTLAAAPALAGRPVPPRPIDIHQFEADFHANRERLAQQAEQAGQAQTAANAALLQPFEWANAGVAAVQSAQELYDAYQGLTSFDTGCIDITAANAPPVPTGCGDEDNTCSQCYRDAYRELGEARLKLEKLRCVYQATKRFADKAIAFGDTSSGVHAIVGLEWQEQKKRILASVDELNHTYDGKLNEFIGKLEGSLQHVGQCEQDFAGEPDWYTRFGFIYFTFMNDRYKRKD
jgi:hypothetical protein